MHAQDQIKTKKREDQTLLHRCKNPKRLGRERLFLEDASPARCGRGAAIRASSPWRLPRGTAVNPALRSPPSSPAAAKGKEKEKDWCFLLLLLLKGLGSSGGVIVEVGRRRKRADFSLKAPPSLSLLPFLISVAFFSVWFVGED